MVAPSVPSGLRKNLRERDLTRGHLLPSLILLTLPLLASSLAAGVAFPLVDLALLSRLGEAQLASVVIVNQTVWQIILMVLMGTNFATQALIARMIGGGRPEEADRFAGQSLVLGVILAVCVALIGILFPEPLFRLSKPDPTFVPYGVEYLRLVSILGFGLIGALLFRSILIGAGDTTTPLAATILQTVVALFAEWVLIFGLFGFPALGVAGAAIGVSLGQWAACLLLIVVLFRGTSRVHVRRRHLVPDVGALGAIVKLSWPPALQMIGLVASTFAYLRLAGDFGGAVQAAYSIGLRLSMIVPTICFPLATACATLVGQALGAGDVPRAWRALGIGTLVHGAVFCISAVVLFVFRTELVAAFSTDPEVIRIGSEYLAYTAASYVPMAIYLILMRALQGAGDFLVPMVISLASNFVVSIPLAYLLCENGFGPTGIWLSALIGTVIATIASIAWAATGRWTRRALGG